MFSAIILAAGQGKRMRSKIPKVLHALSGKPLLAHSIEVVISLTPKELVVVTSPKVSEVVSTWPYENLKTVIQDPPAGTADAVRCGLSALSTLDIPVMVLPGDVPLIRASTLKTLLSHFEDAGAALTILGADVDDPFGYGRLIMDSEGRVTQIVEERDASEEEKAVHLINSGIMVIRGSALQDALREVASDNAQREFYLTDLAAIFHAKGLPVTTIKAEDPDEILGVNDRVQLDEVQKKLLTRLIRGWQVQGVTFILPETCYLDTDVTIGMDTIVEPGVQLCGPTRIGEGCRIGRGAVIENSIVEDGAEIRPYSVIEESVIQSGAVIGPFAHLRPGSEIGEAARVGNFVEVKKSKLAPGVKASHLTYLGDTTIGANTNIGAGTITCNYDGAKKHPTHIGKEVFVGSNTALVAPVEVGDGAIIAAGSTITKKVPPKTLAVGRARQQIIYRKIKRREEP